MTWKKKGNRIRASDKSLVYHFCIGWLLLLFVEVFLLLNLQQLLVTDWKDFNLLHAGITWTAYNSITVLIATGVCALVAFLYYHYGYDRIKRLLHRQKLARMVLENKWYEAENTKDSGFFTDLQSRSREKIVWFPKIYYQMDNGLLHILCEITMGKYQEQLLSLEDKLESGLYCELTDKTLHDGYIEYTLLYDMIANRISIDEVIAENGGLRLMKNLVWEYDSLPHALICGGTGGGKTYFLLTIIDDEKRQRDHDDDAGGDREKGDVGNGQLAAEDLHSARDHGGIGARGGLPDEKRGVLEEIAHADGGDEHRKARRGAQGLVGKALDDDAEDGAHDNGHQHRDDAGKAQIEHRAERYVTADHDDVAVGKVQHLGNAVDHRIAEGDDGVHAAEADAADEIG